MIDFVNAYPLLIVGVLCAGFAAGFAGGLFGIGGGIITVPVLYAIFNGLDISDDVSLKTAIGTSLAVIIVTSLRSLSAHHKGGHVDFGVLRSWSGWIALGAGLGGFAAKWVPAEFLTIVFAGGAIYIAIRRLNTGKKKSGGLDLYKKRMKILVGTGTGLFSALMGLGGGALGVMIMTASGRAIHQAVATSAGFGVAVAVPGLAGFIWSGQNTIGLPPGSFGFFNVPAFAAMAVMAAVAAPIGARLAHRTNGALLSKLFGIYVLIAALGLVVDMFF